MSGIDPRLYGRAESFMEVTPEEVGVNTSRVEPTPGTQVDIASSLNVGAPAALAAAAQRTASLEEPGVLAALGAGVAQWDALAMYELFTKPAFEPDGPNAPSRYDLLQQTPFVLTGPEEKKFTQAGSTAEAMWLLGQYQDRRDAAKVSGEHPFLSMVAMVADPPYIAMGGVAINAARAAKAGTTARAVGAGVQGAGSLAISLAADEVAPVSNAAIAANVLFNMAAGAMIVQHGKLVPKDVDYPAEALAKTVQPGITLVNGIPTPTQGVDAVAAQAVTPPTFTLVRGIPTPTLAPAASHVEVAQAVERSVEQHAKSWSQAFGETIMWNVNKTMRKLGGTQDDTADLLVDNNLRYGVTSVESEKRAVKADFVAIQHSYEDKFRDALGQRGFGFMKQLSANKATREASAALEADVSKELMRRETLANAGRPIEYVGVNPQVKELADLLGALNSKMLDEAKAAGVAGAEVIQHNPGYFHRVYSTARIEKLQAELQAAGRSVRQATDDVTRLFQASLRKANPKLTDEMAHDVAHAIVSRVNRKAHMEDAPLTNQFGTGTAAEIRDMLRGANLPDERIQRVVDVLVGKTDEGGKAPYMKHRVLLDYDTAMNVGNQRITVADLIETNINTIMDKHIDSAASMVAFARKGLKSPSDIDALRQKYIAGAADRRAAAGMFDNVVSSLQGRPVGDQMHEFMRNAQGFNRMITLGASGLWQATEYATIMARYGMLKTLKYAMAEAPGFKSLMQTAAKDKNLSRELKDILTNAAEQNLRLRPYIQRFEDNFEIPLDSRTSMFVQQGAQLVPYLNAMKFIHSHQARVHANLLLDVLKNAANGNQKAAQHLMKYGIESRGMDKLKEAISKHGFSVDKWDDGVWAEVRPALIKMTDEAVLHQRMGDMPAFAQFSQAGKFIMTYRSFVLTAHNKILAGTTAREGFGAVALLSLYQFPLAMMATQVNEVASGRPALDEDKLITKSIGQMGALGLAAEMWNFLSGNKREVGSPGLIPFDRVARAGASSASAAFGSGEASKAAADWMAVSPLLSVMPGWKMLQNKED